MKRYKEFVFADHAYDEETGVATFRYHFDNERWFVEKVTFEPSQTYNRPVFKRALFLAFIVAGISYYKCFPSESVRLRRGSFSVREAAYFTELYRDGLSQFVYENALSPDEITTFKGDHVKQPLRYDGTGTIVLQSGGKDSLLLAELLSRKNIAYTALYMRQSETHPAVIDSIGAPVRTFQRTIDRAGLHRALSEGALNGHVPITSIVLAYSLLDAVLHNQSTVLAAIGQEGEEPHAYIGPYAVRHQWAKTWRAEQIFADYVTRTISPDIYVGSPLRGYSELKIVKLFTEYAWQRYGSQFSSCNVANYMQGLDNTTLRWCGKCPKCVNAYLLFSSFVDKEELIALMGRDMYGDESLLPVFKGLLGIEGHIKPFECVGEIDELRYAYRLARQNGYDALPFSVPESEFAVDAIGPHQSWAHAMIQ